MNHVIDKKRHKQRTLVTESAAETFAFGCEFAKQLSPSDVICFQGHLGSGKTTCIKGICQGVGVTEHVTSPTFTLINEYQGFYPVYHFDFYRIQSENELVDLGLDDYFYGNGICLIEWPAVVRPFLPKDRYEIHLNWDFDASSETRRSIAVYTSKKMAYAGSGN